MLKKLSIIILIAALLCCGGIVWIGAREGQKLSFAVLSDVHVYAKSLLNDETYSLHSGKDKMEHLSEAILESAADEIIESDLDFVLVSGDIANDGDFESLRAAARIFKKIEDGGKPVYVINGNHDLTQHSYTDKVPSREQFIDIFGQFGYDEALEIDEKTRSYTADLGKNYRLIAIDDCPCYFEDNSFHEQITDELIEWTENQLIACKNDNKTPIAMTHIPLVAHWPEFLASASGHGAAEKNRTLLNLLADNGVKCLFTGHNHGQDVTSFTTKDGNEIFDIQTAATVLYPSCYRTVKVGSNGYELSTTYVERVKAEYLPSAMPSEERSEVLADFPKYAEKHMEKGMSAVLKNVLSADYLAGLLKLKGAAKRGLEVLVRDVVNQALFMPLYKDGANGQTSLEGIMEKHSVSLPETDCGTLLEVGIKLLKSVNNGDENMTPESPELKVIKYGILNVFYLLSTESTYLALKEAYPEIPRVTMSGEDIFKEGKINAIDSNFISMATFFLSEFGILPEEFKGGAPGSTTLIKVLVTSLLGEEWGVYFSGSKDIMLGEAIDQGIFKGLVSVFVKDVPPADNFLYVAK